MSDNMNQNLQWQIKLKNLEKMDYPLRYFEFEFVDADSKKSYIKYWAKNAFPIESPLNYLENRRLPTEEIRQGVKAIARLKQQKGEATKELFKLVVILEDYDEGSSESQVQCEVSKNIKVNVCLTSLYKLNIEKQLELTGLKDFEYMTKFKQLILSEKEFTKILTVKNPKWGGTHFSVTLLREGKKISINEKLKKLMNNQNECEVIQMRQDTPNRLDGTSTICTIRTEIGSWIAEKPIKHLKDPSPIHFHVSKIPKFDKKALVIHPVKYWPQFLEMEARMQIYGRERLHDSYFNFEDKGDFLLAAQEKTDLNGKKFFKFYRGYHTGEVSIAGGTHKIAFVDYLRFVWVENGNMMPLLPEHCLLPMMGGKCHLITDHAIAPDKLLRQVQLCNRQHCAATVEALEYFQDLFPVFTVRNITITTQPGR